MPSKDLQKNILLWFRKNKRPLPWRYNKNWYTIWISEVMLQQTQVEQVIPYFYTFIRSYETVDHLAKASEQNVLKIWEGLGYYSRARNVLKSAKILVDKHNGILPRDREQVIQLPGFGPYISNAVLSLAFNLPLGVVDGNIKRVITRLFMIKDDIRKAKTQQIIQKVMDQLLPPKKPGEFNEAMMELGATICLPRVPLCERCPVSNHCMAFTQNVVKQIPVKSPRPKVPVIKSIAFIIKHKNTYLIARRPSSEMLAGLWEFPRVKTEDDYISEQKDAVTLKTNYGIKGVQKKVWEPVKHTYTHFHLRLISTLFIVNSADFYSDFYTEYRWYSINDIKKLPLHRAMWKVIHQVEADLKVIS